MARSLLCLASIVSLLACAGARSDRRDRRVMVRETAPGTFVAQTPEGEVKLYVRELDTKKGLAVLATNAANSKDRGKILCEQELVIGSHLPQWVCLFEERMDDSRREAQDVLRSYQNTSSQINNGR
jgi:hypothetical protein